MILRKPYAFFIKMFKPIHLIISIFVAYLIYLQNNILNFFNSYIYSSTNVVGQDIKTGLVSNYLYIIPIIIMIFCLIFLGVMFRKKKPVTFYIVNIFAFIVVIVINAYCINFLGVLEKNIVAIKTVKLVHDLTLINVGIEITSFIFFIVRGMGINFKKFDFDSEISKFNINESDKEEFEVNINVDLDENKRKRRRTFRHLKYIYIEKKVLINIILSLLVLIIGIVVVLIINLKNKVNVEGITYSTNTFDYSVTETLLLNSNYKGKKLTDNYLIVVKTKIRSKISSNSLFLKDFSLKIGETIFKPTTKYSSDLIDIGFIYNESILSLEETSYLFIYEIPEKYINSDITFSYNDKGFNVDILLNPKRLVNAEISKIQNLTEEISFNDTLGDIKFKINDYDINDKYLLEYNYCIKKDDCILSKEYLTSSIDENFDKYILRLNVEYVENTDLDINSFYKFFSKFGTIYYNIDGNWKSQTSKFEEIKSKKTKTGNNVYIGINSEISNALNIKLVFDIRGSKYEYVLK